MSPTLRLVPKHRIQIPSSPTNNLKYTPPTDPRQQILVTMLSISKLAKRHGAQTLFCDATVNFNPNNHYGIVNTNGSGKSTILRIVAKQKKASENKINIDNRAHIDWLKQNHFAYEQIPILDVIIMRIPELYETNKEKKRLLKTAHLDFDADRYTELENVMNKYDDYSQKAKTAELLEKLNIPTTKHREPMSMLSENYKLRVLLAQTLISQPDILLLDKPTNHLDILSIHWLEKFLLKYHNCVLIVSHNHRFLNAISTHIIDINYERITIYPNNYNHFEIEKLKLHNQQKTKIDKHQKKISNHKTFIEHFRTKTTKAQQTNNQIKHIQKIIIKKLPQTSQQHPQFNLKQYHPNNQTILKIKNINKNFKNNTILKNISIKIKHNNHLTIINPNNINKSTLLKIIMNKLAANTNSIS